MAGLSEQDQKKRSDEVAGGGGSAEREGKGCKKKAFLLYFQL